MVVHDILWPHALGSHGPAADYAHPSSGGPSAEHLFFQPGVEVGQVCISMRHVPSLSTFLSLFPFPSLFPLPSICCPFFVVCLFPSLPFFLFPFPSFFHLSFAFPFSFPPPLFPSHPFPSLPKHKLFRKSYQEGFTPWVATWYQQWS